MITVFFVGGEKSSNDDYWYCNDFWVNVHNNYTIFPLSGIDGKQCDHEIPGIC